LTTTSTAPTTSPAGCSTSASPTNRFNERLEEHQALGYRDTWHHHIATLRFTRYDDRATAMAAESAAIGDEDPVFNIAGRPRERFIRWMVAYPDRHADDITEADIEEHDREWDRELARLAEEFLRSTGRWIDY
jgi:hypothetical protein